MRILIITQKIDENEDILGFFCSWLNELGKKIDKIYVLALEKGHTDLPKNIKLYSLDKGNGNNRAKRFIKLNYVIAKIILNRRADIIFVHMCPEYAILAWPYAKLKNIPLVMWYAHGNTNLNLKIAHFLVDRVVTSSKDGFRLKSNKVVITGQGIDIEKFSPFISGIPQNAGKIQNNGKKIILSVGRISPIKDYETLIKAADILVNKENIRDLKFQIVGGALLKKQGPYLYFLRDKVSEYMLEDYVQFVGPVPYTQIQNYYQNCYMMVSTSGTGSLDKVVLEAMACGKIALTSNEAFRDVLGEYSKLLMFEKKNASGLAGSIISVIQMSEEIQERLGQNLRQIVVQKHNINGLAEKFIKIFTQRQR